MVLNEVAEGRQGLKGLLLVQLWAAQLLEVRFAYLELRLNRPLARRINIDDALILKGCVDPIATAKVRFGEEKLRLGDPTRAGKIAD